MPSNQLTSFLTPKIPILALLICALPLLAADLEPEALRCEYLRDPRGIDIVEPRLSWQLEADSRGQRQTGYQILVASRPQWLKPGSADLWDTGKRNSDETTQIAYQGRRLESRQQAYWKVRVWDAKGDVSDWSETGSWSAGLLSPEDWKAQYISFRDTTPVHKKKGLFLPAARQYRKEFTAEKRVKRATIYATALGIYELHLNGKRIGDAHFAPGWTDYHKRAYYWTYDVTGQVRSGSNALGAWVADGWYSGYLGFGLLTGIGTEKIGRYTYGKTPAFMAQLELEYSDGTRKFIVTDKSWKVTGNGPIQEADFLMGEFYDARKETPGWSLPGFNDSTWESAIAAEENGQVMAEFYEWNTPQEGEKHQVKGRPIDLAFKRPEKLEAFPGVPVRPIEEIKPIEFTNPTNGVYIYNLGQNFAGVIRLRVKGPEGTTVRIRYGEMLHPDGRLMTENLRKARAIDHYVLRGDPKGETYTPRFTFHGFQYVELSGLVEPPTLEDVTGIVLHSDTPLTSGFECSDSVVNRLFKNIVWTQRANFLDLPTDCPQRDERFGWTGDAQIYVRAATYNADVASFYTKWLRELMESQRPSGAFPGFAPYPFQHGLEFGTAWADAGVICPFTIYQAYGDRQVIDNCWEPMRRFIEWRKATSTNYLGVSHGNNWGDWLSMGETTPLDYIDTVYFAYSTRLMMEMARASERQREAEEYATLYAKVKQAFQDKYVKPDGSLTVDTQTAYVLALWMDLMPDSLRMAAGKVLADKIRSQASADNSGITTGFLGTRPLLTALSDTGSHDLAVQLLQSRKFPSWGFEVANGATTIWERWNSFTKDKGFGGPQNAQMNSFSHYSFGAVVEWMLGRLAGIEPAAPGWRQITIRPTPPTPGTNPDVEPINFVRAHYDSIQGRIVSDWRREPGKFEVNVTIPPNTHATVILPCTSAESIRESGKPLDTRYVRLLRFEGKSAVLVVEPGQYRFAATYF
jgi:alpha-L-rhamnosidase